MDILGFLFVIDKKAIAYSHATYGWDARITLTVGNYSS